MRKLALMILLSLLLVSCEMNNSDYEKGAVYLVSCSLDYRSTTVNSLVCTNEDQKAVIEQFSYLASLQGKAFYSYSFTQDGNNIYERTLKRPILGEPVDRINAITLSSYKNNVRKKLEYLSHITNSEDLIIFYYAGHGVNSYKSEDENIRYLNGAMVMGNIVFPDIGDWRSLDENIIYLYPLDELRLDLSEIPGRKLILLDSCYSGEIIKDELKEGDILTLLSKLTNPSRIYSDDIWEISGSRYDEQSFEEIYDDEIFHGIFTSALLSELGYRYEEQWEGAGKPSSGKISVYSLYEGIRRRINEKDQNPDTSSSFVDLVLFTLPGIART
ncbi:MAG: caspase family protein [Sphaerochaetaceae bacterium]|nr:caspase family protein [Sphaerochaetaceae bacterium]